MKTWFEVGVKYTKIGESGRERKVVESYLLDAVSFTEAEARVHKELKQFISGEFIVTKMVKSSVSEIFQAFLGDRWFKGKVTFVSIDEESGKQKRFSQNVLVFGETVRDANDTILETMKGMIAEFEISAISESTIMGVFPYIEEDN